MAHEIERLLPQTDLLLFSDFNYGCLPQAFVNGVVERGAARKIMMSADSQASSQFSNISRFKGMHLITPTEREARLALQDFESGLVVVGHQLRETANASNVVITLGAEGMLVHGQEDGVYRDDRLPAFNTSPKDVAGAGEFIVHLCIAGTLRRRGYLAKRLSGALAAACQISRVGNLPLRSATIEAEIDYVQH